MKDFTAKEASSPPERKSTSYQSTYNNLMLQIRIRIRIRIGNALSWETDQNEQINLISSLSKWLLYLHRYVCFMTYYDNTYMKYISHVKIQLFVTAKSDQDPDPDPH
jgi:hypothetical protein